MTTLPGVPLVESPFFASHFNERDTAPELLRVATELNTKGYAVIDFPDDMLEERIERIIADLEPRYPWEAWKNNETGLRVQDAWVWNDDVRAIASNQKILDLLSSLYGRKAFPFQTLNFPVGTQQHYHTDSVHFSSMPERFMCGVWVALEDIEEDSGPLVYYPGSHKWPIYVNEHVDHIYDPAVGISQAVYEPLWRQLVQQHGIEADRFVAKKGQALIWAANLLHGGDAHLNKDKTRWSQVSHYYFEGCSYYTPMLSNPALGMIKFREPVNMLNYQKVKNIYCGMEVDAKYIAAVDPAESPDGFDATAYYLANPDVLASGFSAEDHYKEYGRLEGRRLRP